MNLFVMYHCASNEDTLNVLDFRMHHHLRSSQKVKWEKRFVAKHESWSQIENEDKHAPYQNLLHWVTFAVKWFVQGINGPFGTVKNISKKYMDALYGNNAEIARVVMKSVPEFILPATDSLSFRQNDSVNCGISCLLF